MKILHVCAGWEETNGAAVIARQIARSQASGGDDVSYAVWASPSALRQADEVWIHCAWMPCLWWAALFSRSFIRVSEGSFDPVRLAFSRWKKRLATPVERFFLRRASSVVATCAAEKEWIEAYEPRSSVRVMDVKVFEWGGGYSRSAREERQAGGVFRVLYMGRRHPLKGVGFLEEAVRRLNQEPAAPGRISLDIVSDATGSEKEDVFSRCDVLCLPTLSDNFGIVVAEALARGKRVITTDGAPAWADDPARGGRLVYIEGYREGSDIFRVRSLMDAIRGMAEADRR